MSASRRNPIVSGFSVTMSCPVCASPLLLDSTVALVPERVSRAVLRCLPCGDEWSLTASLVRSYSRLDTTGPHPL